MIYLSYNTKLIFLCLNLFFSSIVFAGTNDSLEIVEKKDVNSSETFNLEKDVQETEEDENIPEEIDGKKIKKWVNEVSNLNKEYKNLYDILKENKSSQEFQALDISGLPKNYAKRYDDLTEKVHAISDDNPFKGQLVNACFHLSNLSVIYFKNGGIISNDDETAKEVKRRVIEQYQYSEHFFHNPHLDYNPYKLNSKKDMDKIIDKKKTDEILKTWELIKVTGTDKGLGLDKELWEKEHTLNSSFLYDNIYYVNFSPVSDGQKDIQRIFEISLEEFKLISSIKEKEMLEKVKRLVPEDSEPLYFYEKSAMDSSKFYSWEKVIVFHSETIGKRFNNLDPQSSDFSKIEPFFQVEYNFYDYDPITDQKTDEVVSIKITHTSK